ncbi:MULTISPECIES: AAA family ATPase [Bacillus]|uniref:AAA family ATPase n=1 Tax=Bacillus TaxID=1386 RepID=UPI001FB675DA|nr:AAA family ATPase [Bacillus altitudinis]UOG08273.1 AAA family ATPase [Bacillus altitudinis]
MSLNNHVINLVKFFIEERKEDFLEECKLIIEYQEENKNYQFAKKLNKLLLDVNLPETSHSVKRSSFDITPFNQKSNYLSSNQSNEENFIKILEPEIDLKKLSSSTDVDQQLISVVHQWKKRDDLLKFNLKPQNKILFHGVPGTGKTLTAKALAKSLGLKIAYVSFDSLMSSYLGKTSDNLSKVFEYARNNSCLILLDEIDAIGKSRDDNNELGELKRIVISLLQNLDDFPENSFLVACTNHPHLLDKALWRRFENNIEFKLPDYNQRNQIIANTLTDISLNLHANQIDFITILTKGFTPSLLVQSIENSSRNWIINEKNVKLYTIIVEDIVRNISNQDKDITLEQKIGIAKKLRNENERKYSFSYLSELLDIPKSTLFMKMKEES